MSKISISSKRILGVAVACLMLGAWSTSSQAQTCTVANWAGGATGLSDANTGTPSGSNRRYGGPCGLRVPADGTARFVTDDSPASETTYIARFYTFLDAAGTGEIILFAADDGATDQVQVLYNVPSNGDLTLRVWDSGGPNDLSFLGVGTGWHSVELVWEAAASAAIAFSVNGAPDVTATLDTSGIVLANANLGNVGGANTGGTIDFDDFDSRRVSRPGRLCRGLTDETRDLLTFSDAIEIFNDAVSPTTFVAGQPDYNEDGLVTFSDAITVFDRAVNPATRSCDQNR